MSKKTVTFRYCFLLRVPIEVDTEYELDEDGDIKDFEIVGRRIPDIDFFGKDLLCKSLYGEPGECCDFISELSEAIKDQR